MCQQGQPVEVNDKTKFALIKPDGGTLSSMFDRWKRVHYGVKIHSWQTCTDDGKLCLSILYEDSGERMGEDLDIW